jgi:DNA-binding NtrC family response regulator
LYPPLPVLLVDDDDLVLHNYKLLLRSEGINNITLCQDSRQVIPLLAKNDFETIILDLMMPHISGEELLPRITEDFPAIPVIVITALDDTETVVQCVKNGAFDFIVKPITRNRLITTLRRTLQLKQLLRENISLKARILSGTLDRPDAFSDFDTCSEKMHSIFRYMEVIASSSEPVLITGETGSGKELIARALDKLCGRQGKLVTVNVAGLDDQLFTDTLFGHVKGAFTDAHQARKGLVEQASEGILFLDEIGDLSIPSQVKLLRLIQEHEYYPIGADVPKHTDARLIVSTNKNLEEMQQVGEFRRDLYYRLCVHHIQVPGLRERKEDIPLLVDSFLKEASAEMGKKSPTVPEELYTLLSTYYFPGNIRELRAMIYDAVSLHSSKKMSLDSFKQTIKTNRENMSVQEASNGTGEIDTEIARKINSPRLLQFSQRLPTLKEAQEILIQEAMARAKNNQSIAAQMLGITRQALNRRWREIKRT